MRKSVAEVVEATPGLKKSPLRAGRLIVELLTPVEQIARQSPSLVARHLEPLESESGKPFLPRYFHIGARGGDIPIRIGVFAAIHGDQPEGAYAIVRFIRLLESHPEIARGFALWFYPVCNPTGFEDKTRHSRNRKDLNREFWVKSCEPEVCLLEAEILDRSFQGIITLHTDDTSEGFYGIANGATLTRHLIEPALKAAEQFLPRDPRPKIDGFRARNGIVGERYPGVLSAPPEARPRPFEIILEVPSSPPSFLKECAFVAALSSILVEYRRLMGHAPNL